MQIKNTYWCFGPRRRSWARRLRGWWMTHGNRVLPGGSGKYLNPYSSAPPTDTTMTTGIARSFRMFPPDLICLPVVSDGVSTGSSCFSKEVAENHQADKAEPDYHGRSPCSMFACHRYLCSGYLTFLFITSFGLIVYVIELSIDSRLVALSYL